MYNTLERSRLRGTGRVALGNHCASHVVVATHLIFDVEKNSCFRTSFYTVVAKNLMIRFIPLGHHF